MKKRATVSTLQIFLSAALIGGFAGALSIMLPLPSQAPERQTSAPPPLTRQVGADYVGRVIRVSDGDTLTVRAGEQNIKIRLAEIDAPEKGQPWGDNARAVLSSLVAGKSVMISPQTTDRYGRTIAYVDVAGTNVNREMISRGAAWAYRDYVRDPAIIGLEAAAQSGQRGLWAMPANQRQPPWDYRAQSRDTAIGASVGR